MRQRLTRRGMITLVGAGAIFAFSPLSAANPRRIAPAGGMVFRHRSWRELVGDAAITTERTYDVRFIPLAGGLRIEGAQVSRSIDAPPEMAPLTELWRKQVDQEMFPFSLDPDGLVLSGSGPEAAPIPGFDEMIDTGIAMLRNSGQTEAEIHDAESFFRWLEQAAARMVSDIPRDLFVPPAEAQLAGRVIMLPGGGSGSIDTRFRGSISPETGLMREATREVTTRTEATSRRIVDSWSLLPA